MKIVYRVKDAGGSKSADKEVPNVVHYVLPFPQSKKKFLLLTTEVHTGTF